MQLRALIHEYTAMNKGMYPPTVWEARYFPTPYDEVPFGPREVRSRIHKRNHTRRYAFMVQILRERLSILRDMGMGKAFEPLLSLSHEEENAMSEVDYGMDMEPMVMLDDYPLYGMLDLDEDPLDDMLDLDECTELDEEYPLDGLIAEI